jgi:ATP adenylyltransferase/5',5'''-P-1,P-4-tetraphosphate phosphorylase II
MPTFAVPQSLKQSQNSLFSDIKYLQAGSGIDTNDYETENSRSGNRFPVANKLGFSRRLLTCDGRRMQHERLSQSDLEAAWSQLATLNNNPHDFVVFCNCRKESGCSRLRKHLQLTPLPADGLAIDFLNSSHAEQPRVPFNWFYDRFKGSATTSLRMVEIRLQLLQQATDVKKNNTDKDAPDGEACPHNVAFTTWWMAVIPCRRAAINKEARVNSLGMLGVIAMATQGELDKRA